MGFVETGEWWGAERWRMARGSVLQASRLAETALQDASVEIAGDRIVSTERELEDYVDAHYFLVDEPASVLRAGLFCQVAGYFEYALLFLCAETTSVISQQDYDRSQGARHEIAKGRIQCLGRLVDTNFLETELEFTQLQVIRNLAAHAAGETMALGEERREVTEARISEWAIAHSTLASVDAGGIHLNAGFVEHVTGYYDQFMARIVTAVSTRASVVLAARSAAATKSG